MTLDWASLREQSLSPGGFGEKRITIWPQLLNVQQPISPTEDSPTHTDEHQIQLDTSRSFVLYPHTPSDSTREQLQASLHTLIVSQFRRRPKLSYFQGYHDIVTVLFLTLPPELQLACLENLSLHRLRDSMGSGLEPVLGLIRITRNLLRLADPELASILENASPLPFFALSNLLTLFSHDIPTLPLIQHIFDYLLCRPPIAVVYLVVAIVLERKDEIKRLQEKDEDGMIHSLLSSLPEIVDELEAGAEAISEDEAKSLNSEKDDKSDHEPQSPGTKLESETEIEKMANREFDQVQVETNDEDDNDKTLVPDISTNNSPSRSPSTLSSCHVESDTEAETIFSPPPESDLTLVDELPPPITPKATKSFLGDPVVEKRKLSETSTLPTPPTSTSPQTETSTISSSSQVFQDQNSPSTPLDSEPAKSELNCQSQSSSPTPEPELEESRTRWSSASSSSLTSKPKSPVFLTTLLTSSDTLLSTYPPRTTELKLSTTFGPQSVIHTWSEDFKELADDDEAEKMVGDLELIVYPPTPPSLSDAEDNDDDDDDEEEEGDEWEEDVKGKRNKNEKRNKKKGWRKRRKFRTKNLNAKVHGLKKRIRRAIHGKVMVTGAVVVLGVAMAIYGLQHGGLRHGAGAGGRVSGGAFRGVFEHALGGMGF